MGYSYKYIFLCLLLFYTACNPPRPDPTVEQPTSLQPEVQLVVTSTNIPAGATVKITALVENIDGALQYLWSADRGEVPPGNQGHEILYTAPNSSGLATITVTVSNGQTTFEGKVNVAIIESAPITFIAETVTPTATSTFVPIVEPATVTPTATLTFVPLVPANSLIAFQSDRDGDWEIFTIDPTNNKMSQLTVNSWWDTGPSWSSDGSKIAFESNRDGDWSIYTMNADGTNQQRLTISTTDDLAPSWSSDGTKVAFQSLRSGVYQIYTIDVNSKLEQQVTSNPYQNYAPVWSPDGTKIAYWSPREGTSYIYVFDLITSSETRLQGTGLGDSDPQWSPDGSQIAFVALKNIYVMYASGIGARAMTNTIAVDQYPTWSPDGQRLAFESDQGSSPNLQLYNIYIVSSIDQSSATQVLISGSNNGQPSWR